MVDKSKIDVRLTSEEERLIDETIRKIDQVIPILHRLEACGEDCEGWKGDLNRRRKQLELIKQNFGRKGFH